MNWGRPNTTVFGDDLDDQYSIEAYYRWQMTKELAITPYASTKTIKKEMNHDCTKG